MSMVCTGCGAPLQMDDEQERGYVTAEAFMREHPLCQRCYRLIHYGQLAKTNVTQEEYRTAVMRVLAKPSLVLYVVDLFDFNGSLVRGMAGVLKNHEVVLVANKYDLLPHGTSMDKVASWLWREARRAGLEPKQIHLVSAKTGFGMDSVVATVQERSRDRNVVVMGMANVGKSSVLNSLMRALDPDEQTESFTTSPFPGTTLGALTMKMKGTGIVITDTPGLLGTFRLQDRVCADSLKQIVPKDRIRPRNYQLNIAQTLFLAGLVRMDFIGGQAQPFVVYVANQLYIHRTKLDNADNVYRSQMGKLLNPPCDTCDSSLRQLTSKRVGFKEGRPVDVVIPGLGWIRLSGKEVQLVVHYPQGVEIAVRPALIGNGRVRL